MSGVRVGTRLEQLELLRRRLDHEIDIERRAGAMAVRMPPPETVAHAAPRLTEDQPLPPAHVIRAWAIEEGYLMPHQRHGRISQQIADIYREVVLS